MQGYPAHSNKSKRDKAIERQLLAGETSKKAATRTERPELIQARRADECHALCPYTRRVCDMNASRVCARFRFAF